MTPSVYLVRHGRTSWSDEGRIQGWAEVPLSADGRAEADALAAYFADRDVSKVVTSPTQRAADTAARIASGTGTPVVQNPDWRERSFGTAEGDLADDVFRADPSVHPRRDTFDPAAASPGGESVEDVSRRVAAAWDAVVDEVRDTGRSTVVVSHVTPIRLVLGDLRGLPLTEAMRTPSPTTGSVTTIDVTDSATTVERVGVDPESTR